MKFRHKLTTLLTAAAVLLVIFGVAALGIGEIKPGVDDSVMPQNNVLSQGTNEAEPSASVTSIGGRELPAGTEIYTGVDPDATVPVFYASRDALSDERPATDTFLHMELSCGRMEPGQVYEVPLLGAVNEYGLDLCSACFTLAEMPVRHDGTTACLPYHNRSGQESTLGACIEGGMLLCEKCFLEVYTAKDDPYLHCSNGCVWDYSKKFIHSASAAGLDACPVCMPYGTDPDTGNTVQWIKPIPMPDAEGYIIPANSTPTQPPTATSQPTSPETVEPTLGPEQHTQVPMQYVGIEVEPTPTPLPMPTPQPTPMPTMAEVAVQPYTTTPSSTPTITPTGVYNLNTNVLSATPVFYSDASDPLVHCHASCGGSSPVSLLESVRAGKPFCWNCCLGMSVVSDTEPGHAWFHATTDCDLKQGDSEMILLAHASAKGLTPCPNCFLNVYLQDDTYHLNAACPEGMVELTYFANASLDSFACPECVLPFMTAYLNAAEISMTESPEGTADLNSEAALTSIADIAAAMGAGSNGGLALYRDPNAGDKLFHSRISCEHMTEPVEITTAKVFQLGLDACLDCLHLDTQLSRAIEYASLPETPLVFNGVQVENLAE